MAMPGAAQDREMRWCSSLSSSWGQREKQAGPFEGFPRPVWLWRNDDYSWRLCPLSIPGEHTGTVLLTAGHKRLTANSFWDCLTPSMQPFSPSAYSFRFSVLLHPAITWPLDYILAFLLFLQSLSLALSTWYSVTMWWVTKL